MAEYLGMVELGALYENGIALPRPTRPWNNRENYLSGGYGNIPDSINMSSYTLGDTPSDGDKKLKWHKIKDGNKTLLICDRNLLVKVSWNDLNSLGYVSGKNVVIDGITYKARLLTGGTYYRSETDRYSGGQPSNNEWDRFITNEENLSGLVKPNSTDLDNRENSTDRTGMHNQTWNWGGCYSWCQETCSDIAYYYRSVRGCFSARFYNSDSNSSRNSYCGWRPVLEVLNAVPTISGTDTDLGTVTQPPSYSYTVSDTDGDTITVTEKLDGQTLRSGQNLGGGGTNHQR